MGTSSVSKHAFNKFSKCSFHFRGITRSLSLKQTIMRKNNSESIAYDLTLSKKTPYILMTYLTTLTIRFIAGDLTKLTTCNDVWELSLSRNLKRWLFYVAVAVELEILRHIRNILYS